MPTGQRNNTQSSASPTNLAHHFCRDCVQSSTPATTTTPNLTVQSSCDASDGVASGSDDSCKAAECT
eukprot:1251774-Ditylum_brightwellii.AAC.1